MDNPDPPDHDLIAFARAWAPYGGGGPEDIFVTFGITPDTYFTRLAALLDSRHTHAVDQQERRVLQAICTHRLARRTTHPHPAAAPSAAPHRKNHSMTMTTPAPAHPTASTRIGSLGLPRLWLTPDL